MIADFSPEAKTWNTPALHPGALPKWLTPIRLTGHHELNYCLALIWTHTTGAGSSETHGTNFQSPYGVRLDQGPLQAFLDAEPKTEKLALFHGLKESQAGGSKNTYGAEAGLALYRHVGGTKYWVVSHNSA